MAVSDIRVTEIERRALSVFLTNGGDKVDAFINSRKHPIPENTPRSVIKRRASDFWRRPVMIRLLQEADVETRVAMERKAIAGVNTAIETYGITKDRIMAELAKIAFAQQTDVMSWGPDGVIVKDSSEIGDAAAAIGEVSSSGGGDSPVVMKVKLLDKRQALIDLGKEIGMFQTKVEHKGQVQMAVGAKFIIERD